VPKPIKSRSIDLKFCTQVITDITDLLQLPESKSDPDIKNSTPGQTFQNLPIFQLSPINAEMTYGPPNKYPDTLLRPKLLYGAIETFKTPFRSCLHTIRTTVNSYDFNFQFRDYVSHSTPKLS